MMNVTQLLNQVKGLQRSLAAVQNRTLVVIVVIAIVMFLRSETDQTEEIRSIRDSLSKMYTEFDPSMITDLAALKGMIEKIRKFTAEDLTEAEEIRKKSQKLGGQIETLQNFAFDKTGKADLALFTSGGRIAGIGPDTQMFYACNTFWKILGCPNKMHGPEKMIQPTMQPGECFRYKSQNATVFIRLASEAVLDAVTIEHITKKLSLTGEVTEAPKKFSVSGLNVENEEPFPFGTFDFNANKTSIETFKFRNRAPVAHQYVKLDFHGNNGNPNETCVYRVRLHGVVIKSEHPK